MNYRSIVGRPRHQGVMVGMGQKDSYVGSVVIDVFFLFLSCDRDATEMRHSQSAELLL